MKHIPRKLKVFLPTLPQGKYTGVITKIRKVRNKPQLRLTIQVDKPKGVTVELIEEDVTTLIGKTVKYTPPNDLKER